MYKKLLKLHFNIEAKTIEILFDHIHTKIFLVESRTHKYVLKELGPNSYGNPENEGELAEYLYNNGIRVPRFFRNNNNEFVFDNDKNRYILEEYIEGQQYTLNTAPDWFLIKSAQTLGQIQNALKGYKKLPLEFGPDFLSKETITRNEKSILTKIKNAEEHKDTELIMSLKERLQHIKRISSIEFDCDKLTYINSHGDYYINQIIVQNKELVIIDWTGALYLPACFEVMMSYTYAAPACKDGTININMFKLYLDEYLKYVSLNKYDIKMMPYLLYFYLCFCCFTPPYNDLSSDYMQIAKLSDNLKNWLYENVDDLSRDLCALYD